MKSEFEQALAAQQLIKTQCFETTKGFYYITFLRYNNHIYFFKYLNGNLVECENLSKSSIIYNSTSKGEKYEKVRTDCGKHY